MKNLDNKLFFMSYANLVAGLFFAMLFIVAGILLKNTLARSDLQGEQASLRQERAKFEQDKEDFKQSQALIYTLAKKISAEKNASSLSFKDKENLILLAALDEKEKKLKGLNDKFAKLKSEIKALNAVKEGFVFELQAKFDTNLSSTTRGSLSLPSEVFFEKDSHLIRNENKPKIRGILNTYFNAILQNKELMKGLQFISIQVYVTDDGLSVPQKIALSSKRADELLSFINSFYKDERLQQYLLVSAAFAPKKDSASSRVEFRLFISNDFVFQRVQDLLIQ